MTNLEDKFETMERLQKAELRLTEFDTVESLTSEIEAIPNPSTQANDLDALFFETHLDDARWKRVRIALASKSLSEIEAAFGLAPVIAGSDDGAQDA
jgi:hypothetical protein